MPDLTVHCTHCSAPLKLKDRSRLGSKVKCPKCGQPFVLQAGDDEWGDLESAAPASSGGRTAPVVSRSGGSKTGKKRGKASGGMSGATKGLLIGGGVLALLVIAGIGLWASGVFSSSRQGDAVAQSSPAPQPNSPSESTSETPATTSDEPRETDSRPSSTIPSTTTPEPFPASSPPVTEPATTPAADTTQAAMPAGMPSQQAEKLIRAAIQSFLAEVAKDDDAALKAEQQLIGDEALIKRLFGPMGNDAWAYCKPTVEGRSSSEIAEARAELLGAGGGNAIFELTDRRKRESDVKVRALLAAMPQDVHVFGSKIEIQRGGRRQKTEFADWVIDNGKVRMLPPLTFLAADLDEKGKLVMPQVAAQPLAPAGESGTAFIGTEVGQVRTDNGLEAAFVWCPAGKFRMGTPADQRAPWFDANNENPVDVELTQGFWIGATEVTREQWELVMGTEPWKGSGQAPNGTGYPAIHIVSNDALQFCRKLSNQERDTGRLPAGWEYTLPTEAQWEYACRAGTDSAFCFGNVPGDLGKYGWYYDNAVDVGESHPHQVGRKEPNAWGLYDMHGNVAEYCRDWFSKRLLGGLDPLGAASGNARAARGGTWTSQAGECRSASRIFEVTDAEINAFQGFRVAIVRTTIDEGQK